MKHFLLLTSIVFCITAANAQTKKATQPVQDVTAQMKRTKTANGNVLLREEAGKFKLYVSYKNSSVAEFYAIDGKGNKIPATYTAKDTKCVACITVEGGLNYCYDISCDDLPKPKTNAVKTAH
jgi:hypothetical protein